MSSDLVKLERARAIPDNAIKETEVLLEKLKKTIKLKLKRNRMSSGNKLPLKRGQ